MALQTMPTVLRRADTCQIASTIAANKHSCRDAIQIDVLGRVPLALEHIQHALCNSEAATYVDG